MKFYKGNKLSTAIRKGIELFPKGCKNETFCIKETKKGAYAVSACAIATGYAGIGGQPILTLPADEYSDEVSYAPETDECVDKLVVSNKMTYLHDTLTDKQRDIIKSLLTPKKRELFDVYTSSTYGLSSVVVALNDNLGLSREKIADIMEAIKH